MPRFFRRSAPARTVPQLRTRLMVSPLEDRVTPATFTVSNALDSGTGSLRDAVTNANAVAGNDTIQFDTTFFATPQTITLASGLSLTSDVTIQGTTARNVVISGNNAFRIFTVAGTSPVVMNDITLQNGRGTNGGGV